MRTDKSYIVTLNNAMFRLLRKSLLAKGVSPSYWLFIARLIRAQRTAADRRLLLERQDTHVPPFLIASITSQCNLSCSGCYAKLHAKQLSDEMSIGQWRSVFAQAHSLGVSFILLAGGEPLVRRDIFGITRLFPDIVFPVFTNGLLIDDEMITIFSTQKQLVPVISLEGDASFTDSRRGAGVFSAIHDKLPRLKKLFFGVSMTVTSKNIDQLTEKSFVENLLRTGCSVFFYVEYIPVETGTEHLELQDSQRLKLEQQLTHLHRRYRALFISFPGDEQQFGGCLAAGRGFVHINAAGDVEACPFAPYSDTNLKTVPLKDALKSQLLKKIRTSPEHLSDHTGGCTLWNKRAWVQSLIR